MTVSTKYLFFAWMELPYFIGISYEEMHPAVYKPGINIDLKIRLRNDLLRVKTSNNWTNSAYLNAQALGLINNPGLKVLSVPRYATEAELTGIEQIVQEYNLPYLHVERLETVVELEFFFLLTEPIDPKLTFPFLNPELLPSASFFNQQVLPIVANIVDSYRVATLPAMRYAIHPIFEGNVSDAFIEIRNEDGRVLHKGTHGFDLHGHNRYMQNHVERLNIQSRFDDALRNSMDFEFEMQFCSVYYLFHMRRWTEAVAIASGVVDQMIKQCVDTGLPELIAKAMWSSYRTRFDDLFNQILPGIGLHKLADDNSALWTSFKKAKQYRGTAVHSIRNSAFDVGEEKTVREHLIAFYEVARWLSLQMGRAWRLDVMDQENLLPFL